MQGKGIVKFFLAVLTFVTAVQYLFILPTQKVEKAADKYAYQLCPGSGATSFCFKEKRAAFLDSMSSEEVWKIPLLKDYTYQELKSQQLALGLDLKGGMSVILQVDLKDFVRVLANDSKDAAFVKALDQAAELQKSQQTDYITLFADAFQKTGNGRKLAPIFARNEGLRDQINSGTSDADVIRIIRQKANETVELTFKLLKERIDKLGVTQPNVSLDAARDLILVELPGIDNPERARSFLTAAAKLEFWNVFRINDAGIMQGFTAANQRLKDVPKLISAAASDTTATVAATDSTGVVDTTKNNAVAAVTDTTKKDSSAITDFNEGPLFKVFQLNSTGANGLAIMGIAKKNQRSYVLDTLLNREDIKALFPRDVVFRWSKDPIRDPITNLETEDYALYAMRLERNSDKPLLGGERVVNARPETDPTNGKVSVSLRMDNAGAKIWGQMTTKAAQDNNREIAILLDNEVVSAPQVINPITGGNSSISGNYTIQEAQDFASILQIGKLPAETKIISQNLVGPSLGQANITNSLNAVMIAFVALLIFMIAYYAGGGVVSVIALFANLFFIFGSLASYGTVLTLPGIAGIVLTMGMAVDANVIIYERIREELRAGKTMLAAIADGFKGSYSAIIDGNVTTILTALVLAYFGLGPIKGFAVVLIIGILTSLFTAVLLSRLMIDWWTIGRGKNIRFWNGWSKNVMSNVNVPWMSYRKYGYMFSGALVLISIISILTKGFDLSVDFKGGYSYNVQFDNSVQIDAQKIREGLTPVFGSTPVVKAVDTENTYNITTAYLIDNTDEDAQTRVIAKLHEGVNALVGGKLPLETFGQTDATGTHITSSSRVGPTVADDIRDSSFTAGIFAILVIFLYLAIRFRQWKFSLGAVLALSHDAIITVGMFSLFYGVLPFSLEVDQAFVAAILTVIGYSVNDTVIVFDRIREFSNLYSGRPKEEVFNLSINHTLSRTIITSGTTLLVVIVLLIFGGATLKGFAFALFVGILFGTYSSVFIASALVVDLIKEVKGKSEVTKKSFSRAATAASKAKV